jgi:hypothetical protein
MFIFYSSHSIYSCDTALELTLREVSLISKDVDERRGHELGRYCPLRNTVERACIVRVAVLECSI